MIGFCCCPQKLKYGLLFECEKGWGVSMVKCKSFICFVVFILVFSWFAHACFAVGKAYAEEALIDAENVLSSAYVAVGEAEKSGGNVSGLLVKLDSRGCFLAEAQTCYRNGDFDGAVYYADLSVRNVTGLVEEAGQLEALAVSEYNERFFQTVAASGVAVVVIVLGSVVGWLLFKRRYFEKVLKMKPEEVQG